MGVIMYKGVPYGGGGGSDATIETKTYAEWDAMSSEEKQGKIFRVTDIPRGKTVAQINEDVQTINQNLENIIQIVSDETVIGKFNGKDLYRKVFKANNISANSKITIDTTPLSFYDDIFIKYTYSLNNSLKLSGNYRNGNDYAYIECGSDGLVFQIGNMNVTGYCVELTYTKA